MPNERPAERRSAESDVRLRGALAKSRLPPAPLRSRCSGVSRTPHKRYRAFIKVGRRRIYLGSWLSEHDAAVARDRASLHFRLGLPLNLPEVSGGLGPSAPPELIWTARRKKKGRSNTSRFFGVVWDAAHAHARWAVFIRGARKHQLRVAAFDHEEDAAVARDRVVLWAFDRDGLLLNFPERKLRPASIDEIRERARRLLKRKATSRFIGVHLQVHGAPPRRKAWGASLRCARTGTRSLLRLGHWPTEVEAALAYDRAVLHYVGGDARLNLPARARGLGPADARSIREAARRRYKSQTTSQYRGVCREAPRGGKWVSRIRCKGVDHFLGVFETEEEAARAYDEAAVRLVGRLAKLNFELRISRKALPALTSKRSKARAA